MKLNTTILCLTVITIISIIYKEPVVGIILWIGYGLYKMDTQA